ncbi:MAG: NYN domain-containing protein [Candidatus Poribacteria bacterium]|nr:NYN domain-containing protein [Candidatus Poribacteria bacterium]MDE0506907.1 NYN domain-containing protein [Candidatus Poribacteria bacterium]
MLQQNIKTQIHKHQLAWILAELLDDKEIANLKNQCGIHDAPAPMDSRTGQWIIENLADAFFRQETAQQVVHEYLVQKTESAIRRVGYMNVQEIQTFLRNYTHLVDGGDFTEIVWALLIDSRQDVQRHGRKLLKEYEQSVHEVANVGNVMKSEREADTNDTTRVVHPAQTKATENTGTNQSLHRHVEPPLKKPIQTSTPKENPDPGQKLARLQQSLNQRNDECTALKKENENLLGKLRQSIDENEEFREKEHRFMEQDIHIQQLQLEIHNLKRQVEKLSKQSAESQSLQRVAQAEVGVELKSFEELVYKSNQTFDQMQSDFQTQVSELKKFSEMSKTALLRTRDKVEQFLGQHDSKQNLPCRALKEQPSVGVFVDVQNMFYAAKDRYAGRVDYIKLLDLIVGPRQLVVAYAYVVQIPEINQSGFLSLLEHNGYTIKSKDLRLRGDGTAKGDWDVGIAIDIVSMLGALDVVILASGDGDFCALAELIKQQGKRVEVVAFEHNTSMDLQRMADQFFPIGDELLI